MKRDERDEGLGSAAEAWGEPADWLIASAHDGPDLDTGPDHDQHQELPDLELDLELGSGPPAASGMGIMSTTASGSSPHSRLARNFDSDFGLDFDFAHSLDGHGAEALSEAEIQKLVERQVGVFVLNLRGCFRVPRDRLPRVLPGRVSVILSFIGPANFV